MNSDAVFLVPNERDKYVYQSLIPGAGVVTPADDLDSPAIESKRLIVVGGVDFVGGIVDRLRARCSGDPGSSFTFVVAPRQAARLGQIEKFLDDSGLEGKYEIIVPWDGFVNAVSRLSGTPEEYASKVAC